MRKNLLILAAAGLAVMISACGGGSTATTTAAAAETKASAEAEPEKAKAEETKAAETKAAETKAEETKAAETKPEEPKEVKAAGAKEEKAGPASLVDYWCINGDPSLGYIYFAEDNTLLFMEDGEGQPGSYVFEGDTVVANVDDVQEIFRLTEDDRLVRVPDDGENYLVRGSTCGGPTIESMGDITGAGDIADVGAAQESGGSDPGDYYDPSSARDVTVEAEDMDHTRVSDYDLGVGLVFPAELNFFDLFDDAVVVGTDFDCYVVARNVTDWWLTYEGNDIDFLSAYDDVYIKPDFENLFGTVENQRIWELNADSDDPACLAVYSANLSNDTFDMQAISSLYCLNYRKGGEPAYLVKTVYVPAAEDSMIDYLWDETQIFGVKH